MVDIDNKVPTAEPVPTRGSSKRAASLALFAALLLACAVCFFAGSTESRSARERKAASKQLIMRTVAARTTPTLQELLVLPSGYTPTTRSDTTVILNHWKRDSLRTQLQALAEMSVMPEQIWVCMFNSPQQQQYLRIIEEAQALFPPNTLHPITSPVNFKYYGRFQLALQAHTKYVWIFDDDVLPGSRFLELLLHTIQTEEYRGLLGTIGWVMPKLKPEGHFKPYRHPGRSGGLMVPDAKYSISVPRLQTVDLLCSMWFLERDWVRYLFAELPPEQVEYRTGEDFMLSYLLRKYANINSYVLPLDDTLPEYAGNIDALREMSQEHATTKNKKILLRDQLFYTNLQHGGQYMLAQFPSDRPTYLVYIDPLVTRRQYRDLLRPLRRKLDRANIAYLLPGDGTSADCAKMMQAVNPDMSQQHREDTCSGKIYGVFDLNLRSFPGTYMTENNIILHTDRHLRAVLHNLRPDYLVSISDTAQPSTKHSGVRRYNRRGLSLTNAVDRKTAFALMRRVVAQVAESMGVAHLQLHERDLVLASHVLAAPSPDMTGLLYCKPRITLLVHRGPNTARQLQQLQNVRLFTQHPEAVVLTTSFAKGTMPSQTSRGGWPAADLAIVPASEWSPRLSRAAMATAASPARLRTGRSPNQATEDLFGFLLALQSYALASPDQYVLYVDASLEEITPEAVLHTVVTTHALRQVMAVRTTSQSGPMCEAVNPAMGSALDAEYDEMHESPYLSEMWYVPVGGVEDTGRARDHQSAHGKRVGKALKMREAATTWFLEHGFAGLYPAHTWIALQHGLTTALQEKDVSDLSSITSRAGMETIGRATLQHAAKAVDGGDCAHQKCRMLALGLPVSRRLLGSPTTNSGQVANYFGLSPRLASAGDILRSLE